MVNALLVESNTDQSAAAMLAMTHEMSQIVGIKAVKGSDYRQHKTGAMAHRQTAPGHHKH
ncbi:hypothetical protein TUM17387_04330 [Shewanella carassii]|uniref:Uncharacterized protein n=1 Tax=Shewanella carassii TaxID=1987584 RepID=A0ABQ1SXX8_9GAMM|nr:hypothetical protein TUM17387_04330 [Shewanella carassii]GGE70499.1 hypothetical protein GCM10011520_08970 [Shewanella carassii]